ncbi:MAG: hypothetical protein ACPHP5_04605, partial [Candidatus Puniceispirillaceae bacterium]
VWRVQPYSFFIFADVVFPVYGRVCGAEKTDKVAPTNYDLHIFSGSDCRRFFHPMARPPDAPYFASRGQPVIRLVIEAIKELFIALVFALIYRFTAMFFSENLLAGKAIIKGI